MEELQQQYRESLIARVDALETALQAFKSDNSASDAIESIRRIAHILKGSGGTFGFIEITAAAEMVDSSNPDELEESVNKLLSVLQIVMKDGHASAAEILVVEDDPTAAEILRARLEAKSYVVHVVQTGQSAEDILATRDISLVLLDLMLPDTDGRNFLINLRNRAAYASLPVVVTSIKTSPAIKAECFALGADGYFEKPVDVDTLMAAIGAKLQSSAKLNREARTDPLTQLSNRAAMDEAYNRAKSSAERSHEKIALAILDIDNFKNVNDTYGHSKGDEVLQALSKALVETARQSDLVARWGGEEFVILYPKATVQGAAQSLEKALDTFSSRRFIADNGEEFGITFSGGVVEVDGRNDLKATVAAADHLLCHAKATGRNKIITDWNSNLPASRHVLLIENDDLMATVIEHRLESDGFLLTRLNYDDDIPTELDGIEVSLAILNTNLGGSSGFDILAELRQTPQFRKIPIIMLTRIGSESDIVHSLELGADDYIMKPFSPEELLARVRRLVQ